MSWFDPDSVIDPDYGKIPDLVRAAEAVLRVMDLFKAGVVQAAANPQQPFVATEQTYVRLKREVQEIALHLAHGAKRAARGQHLKAHAMERADDHVEVMLAEIETVAVADGFDPRGFFVYELWGEDSSRPLYVGQSSNVLARLGSHLGDAVKRASVRRVSLIRCRDFEQMDRLEARLIAQHQPPWNVIGTDGHRRHPAGDRSPRARDRGTSVGLTLDGDVRPEVPAP